MKAGTVGDAMLLCQGVEELLLSKETPAKCLSWTVFQYLSYNIIPREVASSYSFLHCA